MKNAVNTQDFSNEALTSLIMNRARTLKRISQQPCFQPARINVIADSIIVLAGELQNREQRKGVY